LLLPRIQDGRQSMQSHVVDLEDGVAQELLEHHEEEFHDGRHAEGCNDHDGGDGQDDELGSGSAGLAAIADGRSNKDGDSSEKEVGDKIIKKPMVRVHVWDVFCMFLIQTYFYWFFLK
jgi:hypothetical protein